MCGCFGNTCTCIYFVLYCLYCVFVLFRLCIFILICFVCKCKDYCHRMKTQLQQVIIIIIIIIIIIYFVQNWKFLHSKGCGTYIDHQIPRHITNTCKLLYHRTLSCSTTCFLFTRSYTKYIIFKIMFLPVYTPYNILCLIHPQKISHCEHGGNTFYRNVGTKALPCEVYKPRYPTSE